MTTSKEKRPLTFNLSKWYAYIFSLTFLLYGGVKIILGVLDRDYSDMAQPIIFLLVGIVLINICFAFRDSKPWGWYGLVGVNGLAALLALFGLNNTLNLVVLALALLALAALFAPRTKAEVFGSR
jgi:hypothetical protein